MWIADVAALISLRQARHFNRAIAVAREVGAERILRLGLRLALDVLGAKLPAELEASVRSDRAVAKLAAQRSEEHTSELQSHSDLVCRLLLEKKKKLYMVVVMRRLTDMKLSFVDS